MRGTLPLTAVVTLVILVCVTIGGGSTPVSANWMNPTTLSLTTGAKSAPAYANEGARFARHEYGAPRRLTFAHEGISPKDTSQFWAKARYDNNGRDAAGNMLVIILTTIAIYS